MPGSLCLWMEHIALMRATPWCRVRNNGCRLNGWGVPEFFTYGRGKLCAQRNSVYPGLQDLFRLFTCMNKQRGRSLVFCLGCGLSTLLGRRRDEAQTVPGTT